MKFKFAPLLSIMFIAAPAAIFVTPAQPAFAEDEKTADEQLLDEIRLLRETVKTLEGKVAEIEKTVWELAAAGQGAQTSNRKSNSVEPIQSPRMLLAALTLPENAPPDVVRAYIYEILSVNRRQGLHGRSDMWVDKLKQVGPGNVGILMEYIDSEGVGSSYVSWALEALATQEHKQLIIKSLREHRELVSIVAKHGWQEDAREILISAMNSEEGFLNDDWITAVAALRSPETYDALVDYFVNGHSRRSTYNAIKDLPIDLHDAAAKVWHEVKEGESEWEKYEVAAIAVENGVVDALDYEFAQLADPPERYFSAETHPRRVILRHTEARGNNKELLAWYEQNKDKLAFDSKERVFRVRGDGE